MNGGTDVEHPTADILASSASESRGRTACKFYLTKRGCTYGSQCKFAHVVEDTAGESKDGRGRGRVKSRHAPRPPVCRLYLSSASGCKYGDRCRYLHPAVRSSAREERGGGEGVDETLSGGVEGVTLDGSGEGTEQQMSPSAVGEPAPLLNVNVFPGLGSSGELYYSNEF